MLGVVQQGRRQAVASQGGCGEGAQVFEGEAGTKVVPHKTTGGAFGTISVQRGSAILEVTTLRTDGTYSVSLPNPSLPHPFFLLITWVPLAP